MWCVLPRVDLPFVIICDDVAKDPSDRLSPLTSAKSYISESRYLARYFPANIPWPMTDIIRVRLVRSAFKDELAIVIDDHGEAITIEVVILEANEAVVLEANEAIVFEANEAVVFEANEAVSFEANEVVVLEANKAVIFEANEAIVFEANEAVVFETNEAVSFEANEAVIFEANEAIVFEANKAVVFED
jgi:hypothetical protein